MTTNEKFGCLFCKKLIITDTERAALRLTMKLTKQYECTQPAYAPGDQDIFFGPCSKYE